MMRQTIVGRAAGEPAGSRDGAESSVQSRPSKILDDTLSLEHDGEVIS